MDLPPPAAAGGAPVRVVSLVPSVTEAVAAMGAADVLVGVTEWCAVGAPAGAARVGGTKNPSLGKIHALRPDLVIANQEENRREDVEALRAAGIDVLVTFPRTVADVAPMLRTVGRRLARGEPAEQLARELEAALASPPPGRMVSVLTLIWRKPWMAVGPDTFADDLLRQCGFRNVLTGPERYPTVTTPLPEQPDVVLLPSEPYAFAAEDLDAVRDLVGDRPVEFVDGQLLTWHGPRTATALRHFRQINSRQARADQ